ncbi:hypothetical protein [Halocatena halophila]|uniref:hypothetical protein n=1 Tax=Halocatena halophila TaxID=2814576 RepID=UPI002ED28D1D
MRIHTLILDQICASRKRLQVLIALVIAMGLLLTISIVTVGPNDRAYPVLVFDIVLVIGSFALFTMTYWYCIRRSMRE